MPLAVGEPPTGTTIDVRRQVHVGEIIWWFDTVQLVGSTLRSTNVDVADLEAAGSVLRLDMTFVNRSNTPITVDEGPLLVDANRRVYAPLTDALPFVPRDRRCLGVAVQPGVFRPCLWYYDVPSDVSELRVQLTGLGTFGTLSETIKLDLTPGS